MSIYDYSVKAVSGEDIPLSDYKGKVVIIVNTATGCGFTPHYEPLEAMYEKYHDKGLEIIDIPCNQFKGQAPGTDAEIHEFCTLKYNTQFPQMKKSDVNGDNALPVYAFLKKEQPYTAKGFKAKAFNTMISKLSDTAKDKDDIKWNFTKFVIDREGNVVARFEPVDDMGDLEKKVAELL